MKFCQNCGKEIADQAKFCVNCGAAVVAKQEEATVKEKVEEKAPEAVAEEKSADLGEQTEATNASAEAPTDATAAEDPAATDSVVKKKFVLSKKLMIIIGAAIAALAIIGVIIGSAVSSNKYEKKLTEAYERITYGAQLAEEYATLESKVWYNCIYERSSTETDKYTKDEYNRFYDDFNDALLSFYEGESLTKSSVSISDLLLSDQMSELKDCPDKFEKKYAALKDLYVAYSDLVDLVIGDSSYSYNTFSDTLDSAKSDYKSALSSARLIFE